MIRYKKCSYMIGNTRRATLTTISFKEFRKTLLYCQSSSQRFEGEADRTDAGKWFTPGEITDMPRRELQKWCKKLGIRANIKTVQMRTNLLDFHQNVLSSSDILKYPFLPKQNYTSFPVPVQNCQANKITTYTKQDKLLYNNTWNFNLSTDAGVGQVRYFKNAPCDDDESLYEDADFYSQGLESTMPGNKLPSISKILRSTASKSKLFAIYHWNKKQKELLGEEVFRQKMNEIRKNGMDFHHFVHRCLVDRELSSEVPEKLQGYLASTKTVFEELGDAIESEKSVRHAYLGYQGKFDTLACYRGNPCIIEWKTSQRKKSSLVECGEYPMQMVAYAGAINDDPTSGIQVRHGVLVIAYEDGSPADVHFLDLKQCKTFWQDWLVRLYKFTNLSIDL